MTVNLSMLAGAGAQFFDNNGDPLSGGKVFTYSAGTTTPQATYTTSAGNVAHANPIVLDAAGRVPSGGEIWLTDSISYKFVLTNSTGTTIGTYDNISGNGSGILPLFSASNGSSLVGFLQAGANAVATTVQSKLRESVSVKDFGAVGDGVTDDYSAISAAINSVSYGTGIYQSGPSVYFPPGTYRCSQTIQLKKSVKLYGDSSGLPYNSMAMLKFDAGISGIVVHRYNTINDTKQSPTTTGADSSIIEGLNIVGQYGTADVIGGHGIWLRARAVLKNVYVSGFVGHGIQILASSGGSNYFEGNANNWVIDSGRVQNCGGWGVYIDGADVNAGKATCIDVSSNGLGGIFDSSFLGNTHIAHHAAGNGSGSAGYNATLGKTGMVWYSGFRYYAASGASEANLIATTPGTDEAIWTKIAASASSSSQFPLWEAGKPLGTYFSSDQFKTDNLNAKNVFIGCYVESGYSGSSFVLPTVIIGGLMDTVVGGAHFTANLQGPILYNLLQTNSILVGPDSSVTSGTAIKFFDSDTSTNLAWTWDKSVGRWGYRFANLGNPSFISLYDRAATVANGYARDLSGFNGALGISGYYFGESNQMKWRGLGTAAPTTGNWLRGDIVYNSSPSAGGYLGWVCTSGGAPGTWKEFGAISA